MIAWIVLLLPGAFGLAAILYLWLAVKVSRASTESSNKAISYFLFLIAAMIAGSAFAYATEDANIYAIGRTLTFFSSGFLPVVLYSIYREYTVGRPPPVILFVLSIIPLISTVLAMTNSIHHMMWATVVVDGATRFTEVNDHIWFNRAHVPFAYGLFGFSIIALTGSLPTIARAHRMKVEVLLICAILPFVVSIANTILKIGPIAFPFTSLTLVALLPLYWWATMMLRVYEFTPLAYQTLFDHVRDPIIVLDTGMRIISANRPAQVLLNSSESKLIGQKLWEDLPAVQAILGHGEERDLTQTVRMEADRYFEVNSAPLVGPSGQNQGTVVVCRDITERKQALRALADSEHLIRSLVEQSSNGILRFAQSSQDARNTSNIEDAGRFRCTFANRAAEKYLQRRNGTLVGMPLDKLCLLKPEKLLQHFGATSSPASNLSYETEIDTGQGAAWLRIVGEPVGSDFSVTLVDITQRKRNETKILADALRDPLTGILNRRGFEKEAHASIAEHEQGAVLYLDLNQFKSINDRFGHQAGDALLKAFGHRLEFCLRPEDIVARLGGDEFVIVLPGVTVDRAKHVAERLVETALEAYIIQGQEIECAASLGIALLPDHGVDLWHLVSVADKAMYKVKQISQINAANERAAYVRAAIAS